jgi:hypothetical protein
MSGLIVVTDDEVFIERPDTNSGVVVDDFDRRTTASGMDGTFDDHRRFLHRGAFMYDHCNTPSLVVQRLQNCFVLRFLLQCIQILPVCGAPGMAELWMMVEISSIIPDYVSSCHRYTY